MKRAARVVLLALLLLILAFVIWLRLTPDGREMAGGISDHWQQWRHGGAERDAIAKLLAMGVRMGRSAPPEQYYVTLECNNMTLGDEGYQLVGKCFRMEAASFIHCDLNDDRMPYLKGLNHLTSLTIFKTPQVTDAGIKNVASLRELRGLLLKETGLGDQGLKSIAQLPDLKVLDLSQTRITDAGMPALANMHTLQWLVLADTAVTDEGIAKLEGLRDLQQISLSGTKVTEQGKARLRAMYPSLKID